MSRPNLQYTFGSSMPGYSYKADSADGYRFGFNGVEDESDGLSNYYSFNFRMFETRLGRFISTDPLAPRYSWNSTYAFAENKVINGIDLEGLEYLAKGIYEDAQAGFTYEWNPDDDSYNINLGNGITYSGVKTTTDNDGNVYFNIGEHLYWTESGGWSKSGSESDKMSEWVYNRINLLQPHHSIYKWGNNKMTGKHTFGRSEINDNVNCRYLAGTQAIELGGNPAGGNISVLLKSDLNFLPLAEDYINRELEGGKPVMVGIALTAYEGTTTSGTRDRSGNPDGNDHFVTIFGRGYDEKGSPYFFFVENGIWHTDPDSEAADEKNNKIYFTGDLLKYESKNWGGNTGTVIRVHKNLSK